MLESDELTATLRMLVVKRLIVESLLSALKNLDHPWGGAPASVATGSREVARLLRVTVSCSLSHAQRWGGIPPPMTLVSSHTFAQKFLTAITNSRRAQHSLCLSPRRRSSSPARGRPARHCSRSSGRDTQRMRTKVVEQRVERLEVSVSCRCAGLWAGNGLARLALGEHLH